MRHVVTLSEMSSMAFLLAAIGQGRLVVLDSAECSNAPESAAPASSAPACSTAPIAEEPIATQVATGVNSTIPATPRNGESVSDGVMRELADPRFEWRSVKGMAENLDIPEAIVLVELSNLKAQGRVKRSENGRLWKKI